MKRYIFVVLTLLILMVLGLTVLSGNKSGDKKKQDTPAVVQKQLHDYASSPDYKVVYTTQGRIVGDDQFRAIRITVARDYRRVEILDSYTKQVQKSQDFSNTEAAYDTFLRALENAGFSKTQKTTAVDERGVCPNGRRMIYELTNGTDQVQRTWSATCGAKLGNFAGSAVVVQQLFNAQITGYNDFVRGIVLS